jgi:hypothetical protein
MQETIQTGTVFFRDGTVFPKDLKCPTESSQPGWNTVQGFDGYTLGRKLQDAGWHFMYLAGDHSVTVLGGESQTNMRKAVKKIVGALKLGKHNSFEITNVALNSFLGVSSTTVSYHSRNIQESMLLTMNAPA